MANVNLSAPVVNGELYTQATPDNTSENTRGTGKLGKDAFLQLLVTQMKYQDPLNPTSDTEYIAQLATFSSLEEMQNLNNTVKNMQGYNLVGEYVMLKTENEKGETALTGGKVDYVFLEGDDMYLNVNGADYSIDDLDTVVTEEYVKSLASKGTNTATDLAQAAQLVGKNVTVSSDKGNYTGEATQAYMDNGTVYLVVDKVAYKYNDLLSVNKMEEKKSEELNYLELLTKDVEELKELFQDLATAAASKNNEKDATDSDKTTVTPESEE